MSGKQDFFAIISTLVPNAILKSNPALAQLSSRLPRCAIRRSREDDGHPCGLNDPDELQVL